MTPRSDRMVLRIALGLMATCLVILAWMGPEPATDDRPSAPSCQEDEACWNCVTMGNKVCGQP